MTLVACAFCDLEVSLSDHADHQARCRRNPLAVPCPTCHARPNARCREPSGRTRHPHAERRHLVSPPPPPTGPLAFDCPKCLRQAGRGCKTPDGSTAVVHRARVALVPTPVLAASPAPSEPALARTKRVVDTAAEVVRASTRWRGGTRTSAHLVFRIIATRRLRGGGMDVAVAVDDVVGGRRVAVRLRADQCDEWGPDEKALRAAVEAECCATLSVGRPLSERGAQPSTLSQHSP